MAKGRASVGAGGLHLNGAPIVSDTVDTCSVRGQELEPEEFSGNSFPYVANEVAIELELQGCTPVVVAELVASHDQLADYFWEAELAHRENRISTGRLTMRGIHLRTAIRN